MTNNKTCQHGRKEKDCPILGCVHFSQPLHEPGCPAKKYMGMDSGLSFEQQTVVNSSQEKHNDTKE